MKKRNIRNKKGITLIALVVTIIVLIILAGISISLVLGNNGIITKSKDAKEKTLSSREEESAKLTFTEVQMELAQGNNVNSDNFQTMIDNSFGAGNATGAVGGEIYIITVNSTGNNYSMDSSGNISTLEELPIDLNPGILEGSGTTSDPYVINSIEDLVALSYDVNTGANLYEGKLVTLGRDLDFNEDSSYANANAKYKYVGGPGCTPDSTSETTIKNLMTNTEGKGFTPIGFAGGDNVFKGNFDGKSKSLTNLYIKGIALNGLFGRISTNITIKNIKLVSCNIKGTANTGGIIGSGSNTTIDNCYNIGKIISNSVPAGGIAGTSATITNSYSTGEVSGGSQYITGYIIGQGSVDNSNKYLKQDPDILANGAVEFESEEEMNEIMDVEKFVDKMNVTANYGILVWTIKEGFPVLFN